MLLCFFVDQVVIVLQGISKRTLNVYERESDCVDVLKKRRRRRKKTVFCPVGELRLWELFQ